jgi:NADPH-dependent curcumin reductase CurA
MTSYHTDQYRFFQARKMKSRETILVTTTTGGMGQFAIQVNNFSLVLMFSHFL